MSLSLLYMLTYGIIGQIVFVLIDTRLPLRVGARAPLSRLFTINLKGGNCPEHAETPVRTSRASAAAGRSEEEASSQTGASTCWPATSSCDTCERDTGRTERIPSRALLFILQITLSKTKAQRKCTTASDRCDQCSQTVPRENNKCSIVSILFIPSVY